MPRIWSLAWPVMLSTTRWTRSGVSKLAPHAIAAVSISQITLSIMVSLEGEQVPEAPTEEIAVSGD